ncbi:uncharacterized protein LOC144040200 [Vanacampus margaritifer]
MESGCTDKQGVVLPIVMKYFEKITSAQWCLLADRDFDSDTGAILADMCTEIAQKLSADTLKQILPLFQRDGKSKCKAPDMDGAMNAAFASALCVPEQPCDYASKMDSLLADEISQRVNRTLALATDTDAEPLVPVIYVPGTFTKLEVLYKMVRLSCGVLWSYLGRVKSTTRCFGPCWRQPTHRSQALENKELQSPKSSSRPKSNISVEETTEAVTEILRKWSEHTDSSTNTSPDLHETASDIVTTIKSDLHYAINIDRKSSMPACPHFDLRLILKTLTNFFNSREQPTPRQEVVRKSSFMEFSKNRFAKLMTDVASPDVQESDFLVGVQRCSTFGNPESSLPASNLETPGSPPPLNFEGIQGEVEDLYDKFPMEGRKVSKKVESLRHDIAKFSEQLRDKIYNYIEANQASLTGELSGRQSPQQEVRHPEVMKNIIEDSVGKFLQQVLLWMEMEPRKRKASADEVCGALKDIDTLISTIVTSEPEAFNSQMASETESETSLSAPIQQDHTEPIITESSLREVTRNFVSMLIITMVKYFPKKVRKSLQPDDMLLIIRRLSDKVLKVNLASLAAEDMVGYSRFIQAVIKYLFREFGSQEKLLDALMSDEPCFDDAVLTHLTNTLNNWHEGEEQSRIRRFFSAVGKALMRPFTVFSLEY